MQPVLYECKCGISWRNMKVSYVSFDNYSTRRTDVRPRSKKSPPTRPVTFPKSIMSIIEEHT